MNDDVSPALSHTDADVDACLRVLRGLADDASGDAFADGRREEVERLVARVYKQARRARRKESERERTQHDDEVVRNTGRFQLELGAATTAVPGGRDVSPDDAPQSVPPSSVPATDAGDADDPVRRSRNQSGPHAPHEERRARGTRPETIDVVRASGCHHAERDGYLPGTRSHLIASSQGAQNSKASVTDSADAAETEDFTPLHARSRRCYLCKADYRDVHRFYHLLCPRCAEFNAARREQSADLTGRHAVVTGGRIKIGYQTALRLLRWGAQVTVTTRFPHDAAARFAAEADCSAWRDRLVVRKADFRDVRGVVELAKTLDEELPALDILINNAAQTVRKSAEYDDRLRQLESQRRIQRRISANPDDAIAVHETETAREAGLDLAPAAPINVNEANAAIGWPLDRHGEPVDRRDVNSWTLRLHEVNPVELLEVLLVNANAPCLLASGLKPALLRSKFPDRYVVNVTGLDGQFGRSKSPRHPHVNMSKAALNMLTRTSADDYAQDGIFMNSVDTGWISNESGWSKRERDIERGFVPPLDEADGAARILDPIVAGLAGFRRHGLLFRHYEPAEW